MDIKQEPDEVFDSGTQCDTQWRSYKKNFNENEVKIKMEEIEYDGEINFNFEENSAFQEPPIGLEHIKIETNIICEEDDTGHMFPVKIETSDAEELSSDSQQPTSQENAEMLPICSSNSPPSLGPYFEIQIDEMGVKKELEESPSNHHIECTKSSDAKAPQTSHSNKKSLKSSDIGNSCKYSNRTKPDVIKNSDGKRFKCKECNFSSLRSNDMKKHKMIHSGEKPFKCKQCHYSCIRSSYLKSHEMIHIEDKPFKCDECEFSCKLFSYLKKHKVMHSGAKPFKCEKCDYSSIDSSNLKKHKSIHAIEKPLNCDI